MLIATALLHRSERSGSKPPKGETAGFLPLGDRDYGRGQARKFSKGFARPVYPYSVVSGGVANAAEVRSAVLSDPVVRAHYRRLDLGKLRPVILDKDKTAYVSYRKGDKVFWTARKIRLFKGEAFLTDGANTVRGRCGNLVSDSHRDNSSEGEPSEEVLNTPELPADAPPELQPLYAMVPWEAPAPEDTPPPVDPQLVDSPGADGEPASGQPPGQPPGGPLFLAFAPPGMFYGGVGISGGPPVIITPPLPPAVVAPPRSPAGPPSLVATNTRPAIAGSPTPDPGPDRPGAGLVPDPDPGPDKLSAGPGSGPDRPNPGPGPGPDPDPGPTPDPVPEPSTWVLAGAGTLVLLVLAHLNRRRSRSRTRQK
jgi:hypothetical protein